MDRQTAPGRFADPESRTDIKAQNHFHSPNGTPCPWLSSHQQAPDAIQQSCCAGCCPSRTSLKPCWLNAQNPSLSHRSRTKAAHPTTDCLYQTSEWRGQELATWYRSGLLPAPRRTSAFRCYTGQGRSLCPHNRQPHGRAPPRIQTRHRKHHRQSVFCPRNHQSPQPRHWCQRLGACG